MRQQSTGSLAAPTAISAIAAAKVLLFPDISDGVSRERQVVKRNIYRLKPSIVK